MGYATSSSGGAMAEPQNDQHTPQRYEDTTDPKNPPNSVVNQQVALAFLGSYLGPLVVFVAIVGLGLLYWVNRGPLVPDPDDRAQVGTTGTPDNADHVVGEPGNTQRSPGGRSPVPRP